MDEKTLIFFRGVRLIALLFLVPQIVPCSILYCLVGMPKEFIIIFFVLIIIPVNMYTYALPDIPTCMSKRQILPTFINKSAILNAFSIIVLPRSFQLHLLVRLE